MEKIIEYIEQKYNPLSIILYGSYANGTNNRYKKDTNLDFVTFLNSTQTVIRVVQLRLLAWYNKDIK